MDRRTFVAAMAALASGSTVLGENPNIGEKANIGENPNPLHISTNTYPWGTFYSREGKAFVVHSDEALAAIASSGLTGYEPGVGNPGELEGLGPKLKRHGLLMRSIYVNSTLHEKMEAQKSIDLVVAIGQKAAELGTRIIVTNPSPAGNKGDAELIRQAESLNQLGTRLKTLGISLAYHNHDVELRHGAREFHHMLTATDPDCMKFCLDAHWVFRGCGNSQVALFDALSHYADRVVEIHLRQSEKGIWTEAFSSTGDIDYDRLSGFLKKKGIRPHLVLEQAVEGGTPKTINAVEAHKKGVAGVNRLFGWMA